MSTQPLEEFNQWASQLSLEDIEQMSDEQIISVAMERPSHPGQYGFMLSLAYFRSPEHLTETMYALTIRLQKVDNLKKIHPRTSAGG